MAVVTEVTERDDALADTRQSGARYRQIVETTQEGVLTLDTDEAISAVNVRAADLLSEFWSLDRIDAGATGAGPGPEQHLDGGREIHLRRRDGTLVEVLLNESPLLDGTAGRGRRSTVGQCRAGRHGDPLRRG
ncbi:MAG: hypothetical protein M3066_17510 [Actinomycetota bacterium]|nr:hypothetical protein [Actinomycetota bacterium]